MIESLSSKNGTKERNEFISAFSALPGEIRREPFRLGLLPAEVWKNFVLMPLPFPREFWLVRGAGGRTVGRIGASVSPVHMGYGYIGFFEVDLMATDVSGIAARLLADACAWLKSRGVEVVIGPLNFNTWFPYRFRVFDGKNDSTPMFSWEPVNPPEYVRFWRAAGFEEVEIYHSQGFDNLTQFTELTRPAYELALSKGYSFRPFRAGRFLEDEVPILYRLSMEGFRGNFLFEPIPLEAFRELYVPIANKIDMRLASFALDPDGHEVGLFFSFAEQNHLVLKTVTIADGARGLGLSNALAHVNAKEALRLGCTKFITALVRSGAQSESFAKKTPTLWRHEYVLLKRTII